MQATKVALRLCNACKLEKPYNQKYSESKASGFRGALCWPCYLQAKAKVRATPEGHAKANAAALTWAKNNPEKALVSSAKAHAKIRSTTEGRARRNAAGGAWRKKYPEKAAAYSMAYRAAKLQRIPSWAGLTKIAEVYAANHILKLSTDHELPLQGELVSGLHVHNNLQGLTKGPNSMKGNRMPNIPECWDYNPDLDYFWRS